MPNNLKKLVRARMAEAGESYQRALANVRARASMPQDRTPTHPGIVLREDFLSRRGESQVQLARRLGISVQRVNEIVNGKRGITPETAWLLSAAFDNSPQFWMNLQSNYDLAKARR